MTKGTRSHEMAGLIFLALLLAVAAIVIWIVWNVIRELE